MNKFITQFYKLSDPFKTKLLTIPHSFDDLGDIVFRRTYALKKDETWNECVIRVIECVMSILLTHCDKNYLEFNEDHWNSMAERMAISMFEKKWIPAGRHLKNMGTQSVINEGSLTLNNCSAISTEGSITDSALMMAQLLKNQCGVGFNTKWRGVKNGPKKIVNAYGDVNDIETILAVMLGSMENGLNIPVFHNIRRKSIQVFHDRLYKTIKLYNDNIINNTRFVVDVMNIIGVNISGSANRRGAQIAIGNPGDKEFMTLKSGINNDRDEWMWASNNSILLSKNEDFLLIPELIENIKISGEPGIINGINLKKYGRVGKTMEPININTPTGKACINLSMAESSLELVNPCGEIGLEPFELCNLVTTVPTNCIDRDDWYETLMYATTFASIVSLLMTNIKEVNTVISKNRRIGVSIAGMAYIFESSTGSNFIGMLDKGYDVVRKTNAEFALSMGIPLAKKVTCIKPDGNTSLILATTPGIHYPPFNKYCIRRIIVEKKDPIVRYILDKFKVDYEEVEHDSNQYVFSFPYKYEKEIRPVTDISIWEQLSDNIIMQRFWADNSVSFTGRFHEYEEQALEHAVSMAIPFIKTISLLKQDNKELLKRYRQLPYEDINEETYLKMINR